VKKISLRPYHGEIRYCSSVAEFRAQYKRICGEECTDEIERLGGRYTLFEKDQNNPNTRIWLIYAGSEAAKAHEISHVLLKTFRRIGHDPTDGDGEPFCYMLSQLMLEAE
jgi:hypothetical protein